MLDESALLEVYRHARQCYPEECCGMILASGVHPCRNVQNDLHAMDPAAHPRTAAEAFCFDPRDQLDLLEALDSAGKAGVIYHSHADGGAGFSKADRASALCDGLPVFPHLLHLIVDCRSDRIEAARLYAFTDGDFREVTRFGGRRL